MIVALMLRQCVLRTRSLRGSLSCGEMLELIGINEILVNQ